MKKGSYKNKIEEKRSKTNLFFKIYIKQKPKLKQWSFDSRISSPLENTMDTTNIRTKRNNFGQPPQRYGYENSRGIRDLQTVSLQHERVQVHPVHVRTPTTIITENTQRISRARNESIARISAQNSSRKTSNSKASTSLSHQQRIEAEIEAEKQVMALEEEQDKLMAEEIVRQAQITAEQAIAEATLNRKTNAINRKIRSISK